MSVILAIIGCWLAATLGLLSILFLGGAVFLVPWLVEHSIEAATRKETIA